MGINGAGNAGFAKQVKHRMGRSICKVSDCIGIGPFEAIVRMEARDLKFPLKSLRLKEGFGDSEKVVEIDALEQNTADLKDGIEKKGGQLQSLREELKSRHQAVADLEKKM